MTGRRAVVGLCTLCALVFSALAAQSAAAATKGTTAFTCKESASGVGVKFSDAHCKTESGSGAYRHIEIPTTKKNEKEETVPNVTVLRGSNITTNGERSIGLLESKQAGIAEQITAKKVSGTGTMVNKIAGNGEHYAEGEGTIVYEEVEVTKPAGKGCKVKGGKVTTKSLKATTQGQGDFLKFEPASGSVFAEFEVEGCSTAALNGPYTVTGSLKGVPNGATTSATHSEVTTQGTLFVREQAAGLEGSITIEGAASEAGPYSPLAATTVETP